MAERRRGTKRVERRLVVAHTATDANAAAASSLPAW